MKKILSLWVIFLLVFAISCKQAAKKQQAQTEKAVSQTETSAEEAQKTVSKSEEVKKIEAVDFKVLEEWLPDKDGWAKSNVKGQQFSYGEAQTSMAEADYVSGSTRVHIQILDSAGYNWTIGQFLTMVQTGFTFKDDNHYVKTVKINNCPGVEEYNYQRKKGQLSVLIKDRFLITMTAENSANNDILYDFFNAFDLKRFE
ncbi:MAG: hypothetical protein NUW07_00935 [Candidatus Saccharicenans sp.]|jgi:hypothetical protein|nr:hypothetical protein [Candidatus Saccharicenans sp.]